MHHRAERQTLYTCAMDPEAIGRLLKDSNMEFIGAPSSCLICWFVKAKECSGAPDCRDERTVHNCSGNISGRVDAH